MGRQLELDLRRRQRGGPRPGAGRPRKTDAERGFVPHYVRRSHRKDDPVHVTLRAVKRLPSLRKQRLVSIIERCLRAQRKKLEDEAKGQLQFQLVHFSIQADHLHLIVEAVDKRALARGMMGLEIRIAKRINAALGRKGRFWAERYHRHDLRTPTETRNALRYVLLNLQKHYRVIGERAFADPKSSATTFDGFARPPWVFDGAVDWPRVAPRSWLLDVGWRRRGLIDPADAPASAGGSLAPTDANRQHQVSTTLA